MEMAKFAARVTGTFEEMEMAKFADSTVTRHLMIFF